MIRNGLVALLMPLVLAGPVVVGPASAQDLSVMKVTAEMGLDSDKPEKRLAAAYAACLAGDGDAEATVALFTGAGWERSDEPDMGIIELIGSDDLYAWVADDGSFCGVWSETIGTDTAATRLMTMAVAGGFPIGPADVESGCAAFVLAPGIVAEVTSSGNDPVCQSTDNSGVRIQRGPAP